MKLTLRDNSFAFAGFWGCDTHCQIQVWEEEGKPAVVIASESPDNTGTSITNAAETVWGAVYRLLERPEAGVVCIERYPAETKVREESFDLVMFDQTSDQPGTVTKGGEAIDASIEGSPAFITWEQAENGLSNPRWRPFSRAEVEQLIGEPFQG